MTDLRNVSDIDIINMCGYEPTRNEAFQALFNRYNMVMRKHLAYRYIVSQSDVDDILQLTWIKVSNNLHSYDSEKGSLKNWLFQVTKSCSLNLVQYVGRQKRGGLENIKSLEDAMPELKECSEDNRTGRTVAPPDQIMEGKETLAEILDEIEKLPLVARDAMRYVGLEGLSYKEAADIMGESVGIIASKVSRTRARLVRKAFA
jgi:RNA polymerase sigma-70 factor (ECF subfamily)